MDATIMQSLTWMMFVPKQNPTLQCFRSVVVPRSAHHYIDSIFHVNQTRMIPHGHTLLGIFFFFFFFVPTTDYALHPESCSGDDVGGRHQYNTIQCNTMQYKFIVPVGKFVFFGAPSGACQPALSKLASGEVLLLCAGGRTVEHQRRLAFPPCLLRSLLLCILSLVAKLTSLP